MAIKALLFDFDGTLWDSEESVLKAWQEIYAEWGQEVPLELFATRIGTMGGADLLEELERLTGRTFDREQLSRRRSARRMELLRQLEPRPGIVQYLEEARRRDIMVAIVSTDEHAYIVSGLEWLGLQDGWAFICCADLDPSRAKPSPVLYLEALEQLGLAPNEAIAIEDSPNGIRAAKGAGLFCLCVPNSVTATYDLSEADLVAHSLLDLPLDELLRKVESL